MATEVIAQVEEPQKNYLNNGHTVKSWLLTLDHKRIGLLYLFSISIFFAIGGIYASLIRLELITPQGDLLTADTYNRVFTMHGVMMIFFFLIPSIPATLGNFLLPLMLGAKDVAFPKLNLLSWYVFMLGAILMLITIMSGGVDTGWTFYPPYSSIYSNTQVTLAGVSIFITGFSSILTGLNFMVTIHTMRAPGLTWFRLPLFVWAHYATSLIQVLGTPVIAITVLALAFERTLQIGIFDPKLGGDPVLFQHMFWFYSHPAVYIMIIPSMGVISELIANMTRKKVFGYHFVAFSSLAIAVFGFLVWGHHMFVSGMNPFLGSVFTFTTLLIAIPSAVKAFNYITTLWKGNLQMNPGMLFSIGLVSTFITGGLTGIILGDSTLDINVHDTYFVVAHFHIVMGVASMFGMFAGIYHWFPKMWAGRQMNNVLGDLHFWITFVGCYCIFWPMHYLGMSGVPRRYFSFQSFETFNMYDNLNIFISVSAMVVFFAQVLFLINFFYSAFKGKKMTSNNEHNYNTLEWTTGLEPIHGNWPGAIPAVYRGPYEYHKDGHDFIPQTVSDEALAEKSRQSKLV